MNEEFNNDQYEIEAEQAENIDNDVIETQKIELVLPDMKNKPKTSKGLKLFCISLVAVIVLSCFSIGGYYIGKIQNSSGNNINGDNGNVDIILQEKPKTGEQLSPKQIYEKISPFVVGILVYNESEEKSEASGVVYSNGYIITNDHIYAEVPSAKFKIYTSSGEVYNAHYVAGDTRSDLAVLKINESVNLPAASFGDSNDVVTGENVCAIGCPNGYSKKSTITTGIVSYPKVRASISSSYSSNFIQTDTAINPGNSGGALINEYGQIVGITSSKIAGTAYEGMGFAIPSQTVKRIVESLIENGNVTDRAKLGISYNFYDSAMAEISDIPASCLYVREVSNESDLFGKLEVNDLITRVNDIPITDDAVILDLLENSKPGDTILLTVIKSNGDTTTLSAKLLNDEGSSSYINGLQNGNKPGNNGEFNWPEGF